MSTLHYFGYSDANDDSDLARYFYRSALFDQLKKNGKTEGKFVVHGIKGAGKTAICNMIRDENVGKLVGKIDKSFGFDARRLGEYASPIEGLMVNLLLKELINLVRTRKSEFEGESVKHVDHLAEKIKTIFKRVISGTKVGYGPIEFDLEKIFAADVTGFSRVRMSEYVDALTPVLRERQGYILIDDVDDVFTGAEKSAAFVEGLLRAVKEINKSFGGLLHCLVFLKSGVFKVFFENAREYDKLRDFISSISWGRQELVDLLAARIRDRHQLKGDRSQWQLWQLEFEGTDQGQIERIQSYLVSRCVSGPRDLIVYCNMAKERAQGRKVSAEDIEEVEDLFSKEKLAEINRDFGRMYPRISDLLQQVFTGEKQVYGNEELRKFLNEKIVANKGLQDAYGDLDYVRFSTRENVLELLYGIGFLGFKRTKSAPDVEFVIANPEPGSRVLNSAYEYRIHHAYREYLNLRS